MKSRLAKVFSNAWGQRVSIIVVIMIVMAIAEPAFFRITNLRSILIQISIHGIMACGMLLVVLVGGIDLSLGSMSALGCVISLSYVVEHGTGNAAFFTAVGIVFLIAILIGLIHGIFDAFLRLPAFIVTLATQYALYGIATQYTDGAYVHLTEYSGLYYMLGNAKVLGIPFSVAAFVIFAAATAVLLEKTTYGRRIYMAGGNSRAAKLVGTNSKLVKISAYVICSLTAVIGGLILSAQNLTATYITGKGYEGRVMMVIVVGGISLMGGEGGIGGVLFGALLVGILNNMVILLGISTDYSELFQGIVIIFAVAVNIYSGRRSMGLISQRRKRIRGLGKSSPQ